AAHGVRALLFVAGGRDAPVALAANDGLADDHLVPGQLGIALDVDAPGAPRSLLAGEASELDEVRACGARRWSGSGRSARRARVLRSVLHRRGSGRWRPPSG